MLLPSVQTEKAQTPDKIIKRNYNLICVVSTFLVTILTLLPVAIMLDLINLM